MEPASIEERLVGLNCHFSWKLEDEKTREFDDVVEHLNIRIYEYRKMNSDRPQKNDMYMSLKCLHDYLYASSYIKFIDLKKALEGMKESLQILEDLDNFTPDAKNGYKCIILANMSWAFYKYSLSSAVTKTLDELVMCSKQLTTESEAHINWCKGFTQSRFGPNKYDESIQHIKRAIKILPKSGHYWCRIGILLSRKKHLHIVDKYDKEASEAFKESIKLNKRDGITLSEYARFLCRLKKYHEGEEFFRRAEKADPRSSRVLNFRGESYSKRSRLPGKEMEVYKAIEYFQKALEIYYSSFTLHKLGIVYLFIGDHPEITLENDDKSQAQVREYKLKNITEEYYLKALEHFDKALEVRSSNTAAKIDKVKILMKLNREDEARRLLTQLIEQADYSPDKSSANLELGNFLIEKGEIEDGYKKIWEAIKLNPDGHFQREAALHYVDYLREKLAINQQDVKLLCRLGRCHNLLNESDVSWQYYFLAYNYENKAHRPIASNLLEISLKNNMLKEAGDWVKKADRKDLQIRYYKEAAMFFTSIQDYFQACTELSEAVKLGSLEAAEKLMDTLIQHNSNLQGKDWWGFHRFCGDILILCDTDSKNIVETDEDVQSDETDETLSPEKALKYSIEDRKNIIRPENENNISQLFSNNMLYSLYWKCIILAKKERELKVGDIYNSSYKSAIIDVLVEAKSLLDKSMTRFQEKNYPSLKTHSKFMFIPGDEIENDLRRYLEKRTGWKNFSNDYPDLFDSLVQIQPGNDINWLRYLFAVRNTSQHQMDVSEYELPSHKVQVAKNTFHHVDLFKLAIESAREVEKVVNIFAENIKGTEMHNLKTTTKL